jgi:hypothetical protein
VHCPVQTTGTGTVLFVKLFPALLFDCAQRNLFGFTGMDERGERPILLFMGARLPESPDWSVLLHVHKFSSAVLTRTHSGPCTSAERIFLCLPLPHPSSLCLGFLLVRVSVVSCHDMQCSCRDRVLRYFVLTVDELVGKPYAVVYTHTPGNRPAFKFLRKVPILLLQVVYSL